MNNIINDLQTFNANNINVLAKYYKLNPNISKQKLIKQIATIHYKKAHMSDHKLPIVIPHLESRCGNIKKIIGKGGFGDVYVTKGDKCAIKKTLKQNNAYFIRECSILRYLDHPNIIKIIGIQIGPPALLGMPLALGTIEILPLKESLLLRKNVFYQILQGIAYCHSKYVWHMDIKPDNMLVFNSITKPIVKLADFGTARAFMRPMNINEPHYGTIYWQPPEAIIDGLPIFTEKIDIWPIGLMLFNASRNTGDDLLSPEWFDKFPTAWFLEIVKLIGSPTKKEPEFPNIPYHKNILHKYISNNKSEYLLVKNMLTWPTTRITAIEAIQSSYFDEIRDKITVPPIITQKCDDGLINEKVDINYDEIDINQRGQTIILLVDIAQTIDLHHTTLFYAILLLDCFLTQKNIDKTMYLLYGIACLYIAHIIYELYSPDLKFYSKVTMYTTNDISNAVKLILTILDFQIIKPSCGEFLSEYISLNKLNYIQQSLVINVLILIVIQYYSLLPSAQVQLTIKYISQFMQLPLKCRSFDIVIPDDILANYPFYCKHIGENINNLSKIINLTSIIKTII